MVFRFSKNKSKKREYNHDQTGLSPSKINSLDLITKQREQYKSKLMSAKAPPSQILTGVLFSNTLLTIPEKDGRPNPDQESSSQPASDIPERPLASH